MKINNKGFMMAEVVVVSAIICSVLVVLYTGVNRVSKAYEIRNSYYDINALYMAEKANLFLIKNDNINTLITNKNSTKIENTDLNEIIKIYKETEKSTTNIYFSLYGETNINNLKQQEQVNQTFKDFINYLSGHLDLNDKSYTYVLISEICDDQDDCKYYCLKVR